MQVTVLFAKQISRKVEEAFGVKVSVCDDKGQMLAGNIERRSVTTDGMRACMFYDIATTVLPGNTLTWIPFGLDTKAAGAVGITFLSHQIRPELFTVIQEFCEVIYRNELRKASDHHVFSRKAILLSEMFSLPGIDTSSIERRADILGVDFEIERIGILLPKVPHKSAVIKLLRDCTSEDSLIVPHENNIVVLLEGITGNTVKKIHKTKTVCETLTKALQSGHQVATSGIIFGPLVSTASYIPQLRLAYATSEIGFELYGENQIFTINQFPVYNELKSGQADQNLHSALVELQKDDELSTTLRLYFENELNINDTAGIMNIHRNTLAYRLESIHRLIGLDPRVFDDAVQIRLILTRFEE